MTARPLYLYPVSRLSVPRIVVPVTTQGGQIPEPDDEPIPADPSRFRDQVEAHTNLAPAVARWTALCVHGRCEVTWFQAPHSPADHSDCGCPDAPGSSG